MKRIMREMLQSQDAPSLQEFQRCRLGLWSLWHLKFSSSTAFLSWEHDVVTGQGYATYLMSPGFVVHSIQTHQWFLVDQTSSTPLRTFDGESRIALEPVVHSQRHRWVAFQGPVKYQGERRWRMSSLTTPLTLDVSPWQTYAMASHMPSGLSAIEQAMWISDWLPTLDPHERLLQLQDYPPIFVPQTVTRVTVMQSGGTYWMPALPSGSEWDAPRSSSGSPAFSLGPTLTWEDDIFLPDSEVVVEDRGYEIAWRVDRSHS